MLSMIRWVGSLWDVWGRGEVHTGLLAVNMRERDHLAVSHRLEENIKMYIHEKGKGGRGWTRLIWLRVGTGDRLL
jgi:hypothetical protein